MNPILFDTIRVVCYAVLVVGLVRLSSLTWANQLRHTAVLLAAMCIFFAWLVFEAVLTSSGFNTRYLRAFATPITIVEAIFVIAAAVELNNRLRFSISGQPEEVTTMRTFLEGTPSWLWAALIGILSTTFAVFMEAQWPGTPPAWAIAASTALVMLTKLALVYWPQPTPPEHIPTNIPQASPAEPERGKRSRLSRLLL